MQKEFLQIIGIPFLTTAIDEFALSDIRKRAPS